MRKQFDGRGISCDVIRAKNETEHFHRNFELIFMIEGHITVVIEDTEYVLHPEEMLLINTNKNHHIYVDEDALLCRVNVSYDMLAELLNEKYVSFWCTALSSDAPSYREICDTFHQIILLRMDDNRKDAFRLMEYYGRLLNLLVRNYKISSTGEKKSSEIAESDRMQEILSYINNNYQEPISLVSLADSMYVSVSTLSRIFKKITGVKFPDYVNQVRKCSSHTGYLIFSRSLDYSGGDEEMDRIARDQTED